MNEERRDGALTLKTEAKPSVNMICYGIKNRHSKYNEWEIDTHHLKGKQVGIKSQLT